MQSDGRKHEVYKNNEHDCIHWHIYGRLFTRTTEKETTSSIKETSENKKVDAPVEKQQEEPQAVQTNEQVEQKQEEVPAEEKKEESTPAQPAEQPVQNNEQK